MATDVLSKWRRTDVAFMPDNPDGRDTSDGSMNPILRTMSDLPSDLHVGDNDDDGFFRFG